MIGAQNIKQAGRLRPHTEPGGKIYAWLKGADMKLKFILYCDNNPVDLGIEDARGVWDMTAFRRHVQSCGPCGRFLELLSLEHIYDLEMRQIIAKGNPKVAPGLICKDLKQNAKSRAAQGKERRDNE